MTMTDRIYDLIIQFKQNNDGNSPSVREILSACDLRTTSAVQYHLEKLEQAGRISLAGQYRSRSIRVTGGRWIHDSHDPQTDPASQAAAANLRRIAAREVLGRFLRSLAKHLARTYVRDRGRQPSRLPSGRIAAVEARLDQLELHCVILDHEMKSHPEANPVRQDSIDEVLRKAGF